MSNLTKPVLVVTLLAAGYLYATPYLALNSLKSDIEAGNATAVSAQVDFKTVQTNVKTKLINSVNEVSAGGSPADDMVKKMMIAGAEATVGMITPENLSVLVTAYHDQREKNKNSNNTKTDTPATNQKSNDIKVESKYKDLNTFEVRLSRLEVSDKAKLNIVMTRSGLVNWKVTDFNMD